MRHACLVWGAVLVVAFLGSDTFAEEVVVTGSAAKVMGNDKVLGEVADGTRLTVEGQSGSYLLITIPGSNIKGWIPKKATTKIVTWEELTAEYKAAYDALRAAQTVDEQLAVADQVIEVERQSIQLVDGMVKLHGPKEWETERRETYDQFIHNVTYFALEWEGRDNWDKAVPLRTELARVVADRWGRDHWETINARLALADARAAQHRTAEQNEKLQRAAQLRATFDQHVGAKAFAEAQRVGDEICQLIREVYGQNHLKHAGSLEDLVQVCIDGNELDRAAEYARQSERIRRSVTGEQHPGYAIALTCQGRVLVAQREWDAAEASLQRALTVRRAAFGDVDPWCQNSLLELAILYYRKGDRERGDQMKAEADQLGAKLEQPAAN